MSKGNLFKKCAAFTDLHLGNKNNSRQFNEDCEEFVHWFVEQAKERGCETCIMLGDFHHNRSNISIPTLNYSATVIKYLSDNFETVYMIAGNHDLFYREKRELHSLISGNYLHNVNIIDEPFVQGDVAIVPWLVGDEWKGIKDLKTKYMFGHFEIPGFKMNAQIEMPDHGEINKTQFKHQDYVFSGHFHKRQAQGNIHYIGNPFGHNFADAWDTDRGAMFLEWGGAPEYVNWDNGPKYITCYLSELLDNTDEYLKPKTFARITLDADVSYEDANFMKETFTETYKLRELKFVYEKLSDDQMEFEGEIGFQTIDQIVAEQLASLDTDTFEKAKLMEIYNNL
jgi:DNA repair exonuclease SbcCD nuclease subunit